MPASSPSACGALIEDNLGLTISGGVAMALDGDNAQSLLSRADAALYSGKAAGRNRDLSPHRRRHRAGRRDRRRRPKRPSSKNRADTPGHLALRTRLLAPSRRA